MALAIVKEISTDIKELASEIVKELGSLGHSIAANIKYDVTQLAGQAVTLLKSDVSAIWDYVKQQVNSVFTDPSFTNLSFEGKIAKILEILKTVVWPGVATNIKGLSVSTLTILARSAASLIIGGVLAAV